jgi:hypothetical protein
MGALCGSPTVKSRSWPDSVISICYTSEHFGSAFWPKSTNEPRPVLTPNARSRVDYFNLFGNLIPQAVAPKGALTALSQAAPTAPSHAAPTALSQAAPTALSQHLRRSPKPHLQRPPKPHLQRPPKPHLRRSPKSTLHHSSRGAIDISVNPGLSASGFPPLDSFPSSPQI